MMDAERILGEAMLLDHDLAHERILTEMAADQENPVAVGRCLLSGWAGTGVPLSVRLSLCDSLSLYV